MEVEDNEEQAEFSTSIDHNNEVFDAHMGK